jgi:glycosyltransferase involved in cell wall biosynthesis
MADGRPADRRLIMVKGYQGWAGRAHNALEALASCSEKLRGYEIVVYAASPVIIPRIRELQAAGGLQVRILPRSPHGEVLRLFGNARIAIGVNATDGVPNAMLEAMTLGAFPIQSDTQSTSEWITDGANGLLVHPGDPTHIAGAILRALSDDALVERAAELNSHLIFERLDVSIVRPRVVQMYESIANGQARQP